MCGHWPCWRVSGSCQDCSTGPNNFPVRSPAIVDMWQVLVLLLTNSVFSVQTEDSLNVILVEEDSQTNTSLLKPMVKAENQILGSSGKESQPGPLDKHIMCTFSPENFINQKTILFPFNVLELLLTWIIIGYLLDWPICLSSAGFCHICK